MNIYQKIETGAGAINLRDEIASPALKTVDIGSLAVGTCKTYSVHALIWMGEGKERS